MFVETLITYTMIQKIIRDTEGNVITERPIGEIELIRPPFRCIIKRNGQEDPQKGNKVVVQCSPLVCEGTDVYEFDVVFWGFKAKVWNNKKSNIRNTVKKNIVGNTWKEAFEQAEFYFNEGCDQYERLLFEREQALKNAE